MAENPRDLPQRKLDSLERLERDKDMWIASSGHNAEVCLVPLSFWWNGFSIFFSTVTSNPTGENVESSPSARISLGHTRDVVLIDVRVERLSTDDAKRLCVDQYSEKCGWNPLESRNYAFYRADPVWIEAWRELNEHGNRRIMSGRDWLV